MLAANTLVSWKTPRLKQPSGREHPLQKVFPSRPCRPRVQLWVQRRRRCSWAGARALWIRHAGGPESDGDNCYSISVPSNTFRDFKWTQ